MNMYCIYCVKLIIMKHFHAVFYKLFERDFLKLYELYAKACLNVYIFPTN